MIKSVLLVGGTGYLGGELSSILKKDKFNVYVTGTKNNNENFVVNFDIADTFNNLKGLKFDLVLILASKLNSIQTIDLKHKDLITNTVNYANFLQFLHDNQISSRIIYISSMTVYSKNNKYPIIENDKREPIHTYGLSKAIAEDLTDFYCKRNNYNGLILRIPGLYGGKRKSGFIFNTIKKIKNNEPVFIDTKGLGYWETINVLDVCELIKSLIEKYSWTSDCEIINVSYGQETDIYSTAEFIKTELKSNSFIKLTDPIDYTLFYLSNNKLKKWIEIPFNFHDTLRQYINNFVQ